MSDKEIDKLFKSRFAGFEVEPSESLWKSIDDELHNGPGKTKTLPSFWIAAASVVVFLGAGLWMFSGKDKVYLQGKEQIVLNDSVSTGAATAADPDVLKAASAVASAQQVQPPPRGVSIAAESALAVEKKNSTAGSNEIIREERADEAGGTRIARDVLPTADVLVVSVNESGENRIAADDINDHSKRGVVHSTVLAMLPDDDDVLKDENQALERRRIRSVGDIVNFVIARVDQRDDKLIEMEENDEGTKISGINLGVIKIKSKKNSRQ